MSAIFLVFPGAHTQGETLEELRQNLVEVIEMLASEGKKRFTDVADTEQSMRKIGISDFSTKPTNY